MMITHLRAQRNADEGIRRFAMRRDLRQLANLIQLTFRSELDQTGSSIVAEMRRLANIGPLLWLLDASPALSPFMGGYVWIANGQLAGNVTLSLESGRRDLWTISNVAVHPDFRGRGIARQLIEAAIQETRHKGAQLVVLEVQTDNLQAQRLYRELGFQVYDTVAELCLPAHKWAEQTEPASLALRKRRPDDWRGLYNLLKAVTSGRLQEVRPVLSDHYRLGIERRLERWLDDLLYHRRSGDWVLEENSEIIALLQVTAQYTRAAHRLQVIVHPAGRGGLEEELLAAGLYRLDRFPIREVTATASVSHPEAQQAFHKAGFRTVRVLDQMLLNLRDTKERAL